MLLSTPPFLPRYHHAEECDDGNTVSGDGCSAQCVIEPGWTCEDTTPNQCSPLVDAAADAASLLPVQGIIQINPVAGAVAAGWASIVSAPTPPGLPQTPAPLAAVYALRPNWRNDAVAYTGQGSLAVASAGDVFVCPCGGGGFGPAPGLIVDSAGSLGEAAGVYVRDGVDCTWTFPYSSYLQASNIKSDWQKGKVTRRQYQCDCAPEPLPAREWNAPLLVRRAYLCSCAGPGHCRVTKVSCKTSLKHDVAEALFHYFYVQMSSIL